MTRVMKGSGSKAGNPKLVCTRAKIGAGCEYHAIDLPNLERVIREGLTRVLEDAPSGDASIDAEVQALVAELEGVEAGISALIDELIERGRSPALSSAIAPQGAQGFHRGQAAGGPLPSVCRLPSVPRAPSRGASRRPRRAGGHAQRQATVGRHGKLDRRRQAKLYHLSLSGGAFGERIELSVARGLTSCEDKRCGRRTKSQRCCG